jgi:mediator of RNA polymerase II transcription subunit 21
MPSLVDEESINMDKLTQVQDCIEQLLLIMKLSVVQLVQRSDFKQVSPDVPVTRTRPKDKVDSPIKFEGMFFDTYEE